MTYTDYFVKTQNIDKAFKVGDGMVPVLKGINVEIKKGDFAVIFGPSGSGKSTLLHTLLGLERPTAGSVLVEDKDYYAMSEDERAMYRRYRVGMIYQQPLWIGSLNVIENIKFALHLIDYPIGQVEEKAFSVLQMVKMEGWATYRPTELSSGQQQKISLARALVMSPVCIVADEPTGNLDTVSGRELMETFMQLNETQGITILMVTHELSYLRLAKKIFHMIDGEVVEVCLPHNQKDFLQRLKTQQTAGETDVRDRQMLVKMDL